MHVLRPITILSVCYHTAGRRVLATARDVTPSRGKRGLRLHYKRSCKIKRSDGRPNVFRFRFCGSRFLFSARAVSVRACFISTRIIRAMSPSSSVGRDFLSAGEHLSRDQCIVYCTFTRRRRTRIIVTTIMPLRSSVLSNAYGGAPGGAYAARCRRLIN